MVKKSIVIFSLLALSVAGAATYFLLIPFLPGTKFEIGQSESPKKFLERTINGETIHMNLLDPEMAPNRIRDQIMKGYHIILYTNQILPKYVDDRLTCNNCHFSGGNTLGGKRGGISLLGVVNIYPRYSERLHKTLTISERINNCFQRSMNGKPLPENSKEMQAMIAYLKWIASEVPKKKKYPWLGLHPLNNRHQPDPKKGAEIYQKSCALCHQKNGEGTVHNPPLWGPHAFNDGAGMSLLPKLASFIFNNMPYNDPYLKEEEALDVAGYLVLQRRPKFIDIEDHEKK